MTKIDNLLAKNKKFVASIKLAREQYKRGEVFSMEEVFADIK